MTRVVDTSVALAWYVDEEASEAALPYLGTKVIASNLIIAELANAVWKKVRRSEISELQAIAIFSEAEATIQRAPYEHLLKRALELALILRHPVYDCIFLALAEASDTTLVTADRRFAKACRDTEYARRLEVQMTEMTGGCQCGRVRYSVAIDSDEAYLCHCRMCQRATGGVSIAFKSVKIAELNWTTREPDRYQSSPIAHRGFCAACGTPLTFEFLVGSETMDLTVGSFDEPYRFTPTSHFSPETWHEEWLDTRGLPATRADDNPSTRDRWIKAVGKIPD